MKNFWEKLPKPFFALAPLANVTDAAFRRIIALYGKPDVMWTEFVSADGLMKGNRDVLIRDLMFTESERPIVAQFFTSDVEMMEKAAAFAAELGFDGIDINMGCPDKSVEKQGAGAKLILNPKRAQELIAAAKRGAPNLPISVKTRLGYNKDILDEWLPVLLAAQPAAITLHARTRKEMSKVDAHWDRVKRAVEMKNEMKSKTLIIGNGDVQNIEDARAKAAESGADGIMLGRAIFGTPWLFNSAKDSRSGEMNESPTPARESFTSQPLLPKRETGHSPKERAEGEVVTIAQRLRIAVEHTKLFEELLGDIPGRSGKNFALMKKHFKAYVEGFPGAKELRMELMETKNAGEVEKIITAFLEGGSSSNQA